MTETKATTNRGASRPRERLIVHSMSKVLNNLGVMGMHMGSDIRGILRNRRAGGRGGLFLFLFDCGGSSSSVVGVGGSVPGGNLRGSVSGRANESLAPRRGGRLLMLYRTYRTGQDRTVEDRTVRDDCPCRIREPWAFCYY